MKRIMITVALAIACWGGAQAQKINLTKAASAAVKGAKALTFSNEDAIKLSKESVEMDGCSQPCYGQQKCLYQKA